MRALLQRALRGVVAVDGVNIGVIGKGLVILFGVGVGDSPEKAVKLAAKCANLRIFEDAAGKMNLSLLEVGGEALVVSQFTLYADTVSSGRRPSFSPAAPPELAVPCYERFIAELRKLGIKTETGRFGADMRLELVNDGPVTLMLEL